MGFLFLLSQNGNKHKDGILTSHPKI